MNIDSILEKLANFCITFSPESFVPAFMSDKVFVTMPNKVVFIHSLKEWSFVQQITQLGNYI